MSPPTDFDLDVLMAARYAYYVLHQPFMADQDYDDHEAEYLLFHPPLPVGSERREDYTEAQRALALYFLLSGRGVAAQPTSPKTGEDLL